MSFAAVTGRAVRWGVMGTGTIAHDFVKVLQALPNCEVAAVGSRSDEGAARFGDAHNISGRHGSYEALARDDSLDIVYVATPSMRHVDDSLLCFEKVGATCSARRPWRPRSRSQKSSRQSGSRGPLLLTRSMVPLLPGHGEIRKHSRAALSATSTRRTRPSARTTARARRPPRSRRASTARSFSSGRLTATRPKLWKAYLIL